MDSLWFLQNSASTLDRLQSLPQESHGQAGLATSTSQCSIGTSLSHHTHKNKNHRKVTAVVSSSSASSVALASIQIACWCVSAYVCTYMWPIFDKKSLFKEVGYDGEDISAHVHLFPRQLIVHRNRLVSIDTHKPMPDQFSPSHHSACDATFPC